MGKLSVRTRGNKANLDLPSTNPMEAVYTKNMVRQKNLNLCLVHAGSLGRITCNAYHRGDL